MTALSKVRTGLIILGCCFFGSAYADTIEIVPITGSDDGGNVGGFDMTDVEQQAETDPNDPGDDVVCVDSPEGGQICFQGFGGAASDIDIENNPDWWQYDHGNVYVTNQNWIEIILPEGTRAVSLWVGASFNGSAWVEASDGTTTTDRVHFSVGAGNTSGYGFYGTGSCTEITKIVIEPQDWGFGNISINQDPCVEVPAPAPLALLLLGLAGAAAGRRLVSHG